MTRRTTWSYGNVWERELTCQKDQILAGGRPLRLLQFKGFDTERSELLTTEQQAGARVILSQHPVLAELSRARTEALLRAQYERHTALPYGWASSACGTELDPATRATYLAGLNRLDSSDARLPGPFDDDGGLGFAAWLKPPVSVLYQCPALPFAALRLIPGPHVRLSGSSDGVPLCRGAVRVDP